MLNLSKIFNHSLLIVFGGLLLLLTACENDQKEVEELSKQFETAVETVKNVSILYSEKGHVKIRLNAPELLRYKTEKPYTEFTKGISLDFFDDSLHTTGKLTANYAIRQERDQMTTLKDHIVWDNALKNERLETEELIWNEKTHKIYSDKYVKITTDDESITGEGFEANQDFSHYKIRKITGTFRVKGQ